MKRHNGFTLFELMVTISMVVLLLTMSSIVYRNTNKRTELIFTAHQVAAMGRLAESYAASAKELDNVAGQNIWGLYFDKSNPKKIIMFVDKGAAPNELYDIGEEYRVLALPHQISVSNIFKPNSLDPTAWDIVDKAVVLFSPPDPKTKLRYFLGTTNTWDTAGVLRVVLKDDANESVKDVRFNFFGLIDVR